jgi:multidrug resistance efflux pump
MVISRRIAALFDSSFRRHLGLFLSALLICTPTLAAHGLMLSAEVYAIDAQSILTPPSNSSPVVLRSFTAEGDRVKAGDVVLRIDGGPAASSIRDFESQLTLARARADKEIAELAVAAVDAERALRNAEAALVKARIDAGIPKEHLSALDFDRYQGELTRTERELVLKQAEFDSSTAAVQRRREDARLELAQLQTQIDYWQTQLDAAEVRAERDGIVVHGFDAWRGNRYDEGSSSYPGQRVGQIVADGADLRLGVRAYALEVDRQALTLDQRVRVGFDAIAGAGVEGRITRIGGAPQTKAEWGDGRYFEIDVETKLPDAMRANLRPGSSAMVTTDLASPANAAGSKRAPARFEGEVIALDSSAIAPPAIANLWMLTLTQLVPDGTVVNAGDLVAAFDGNELMRQLNEKQSSLNEKQTQLERLQLELSERARAESIATAEQLAKLTKAQRKAAQPANLIAAMEYGKLVAERQLAEQEMRLVERREVLAAEQRRAEKAQISAELGSLKLEVDELQSGLSELNVKAPRAGIMLHLSNWQGEKFDVGSQVFRGQSVAQIPELTRLAVVMQVPEREVGRLRTGQVAKVDMEGGAVPTLSGRISEIGRVVRSRSRVKPIPVVDVRIELDRLPDNIRLKPGQPARVELASGDST